MSFEQLIGHERAMKLMRGMLSRSHLPHALLFTGPKGVGKTTLALSLARAVNCLSPDSTGGPCGECLACGKITRGTHPDLVILEPEGRLEQIKIDTIRDLRSRVMLRPFEGKVKVFIIKRADRLNEIAANALLKTLEEPPPDSLIILTAAEAADLIPTVLSRCFRTSLAPLSRKQVLAWLEKNHGQSGHKARLLASISRGSLGKVIEHDIDLVWEKRNRIMNRLLDLNPNNPLGCLVWAEELAGDDDGLDTNFDLIRFWYRDLMLMAAGCDHEHLVNLDVKDELTRFGAGKPAARFIEALHEIDRAVEALSRLARKELVLENMILNLAGI